MKQGAKFLLRERCCVYTSDKPLLIAVSNKEMIKNIRGKVAITNYNSASRCFLSSSSKGSKHRGISKRPKLSTPSKSLEALWCTSATSAASRTNVMEMGRYGLKRLDYTTMKPPVWSTPPHPPTKTTAERVVFPLSLVIVAGIVAWVYMSPEEDDMTEYWKRVENGQLLLFDDDDEGFDEDEDDDE